MASCSGTATCFGEVSVCRFCVCMFVYVFFFKARQIDRTANSFHPNGTMVPWYAGLVDNYYAWWLGALSIGPSIFENVRV